MFFFGAPRLQKFADKNEICGRVGRRTPTPQKVSRQEQALNFRKRRAPKKRTFEHMSHVSALAHCIFVYFAQIASIK